MMLLSDKERKYLTDIFELVDSPFEVWAYGSRVTGTAHDASDLDLVIMTPDKSKMPLEQLNFIKEKIRHSNIPIIVELFDWARLPESFHQNILAHHEVLFKNVRLERK